MQEREADSPILTSPSMNNRLCNEASLKNNGGGSNGNGGGGGGGSFGGGGGGGSGGGNGGDGNCTIM